MYTIQFNILPDKINKHLILRTLMNQSRSLKASSVRTSPVKHTLYHHLEEDKKQILDRLLYLFTFYSSKISKYSYKDLNEKYFMELIVDIHQVSGRSLPKNKSNYKDYQNIYYAKGKKHGLMFSDFLQTIPTISVYFCPNQQREQAVRLVVQALLSLYDAKVAHFIEAQFVDYHEPINDDAKQMILKLAPSLLVVYKIYFPQEFNGKFNSTQPTQQSFESFLRMMKDFQVYPKLVSASSLYFLYSETLKAPPNNLLLQTQYIENKLEEKGQLFTLSKMIQCLVSTSRICLTKLKNIENPQYDIALQKEILKTLFQYMETVKATKSSFKNSIFKEHRFSFILYEEYPQQSLMKTFFVQDKLVKESQKDMDFFTIFDKMKI